MMGTFTTPGMVHGMQSKTIAGGISAGPHHYPTLASKQNTASTKPVSRSLDQPPATITLANKSGDADSNPTQQQQQQTHQLGNLANTKEKTPMCLINELARYNKVTHQYTLVDEQGPAHKKTFFVKLQLGDKEEYSASGPSIKKAQHAAAGTALEKTEYKHPPPKPYRDGYIEEEEDDNSITPTVELNALAMKRGEPAIYKNIENRNPPPMYYHHNYDFRGMYNQRYHYMRAPRMFFVSLKVGSREFIGEGNTRQMARHNAAKKALEILRNLPVPEGAAERNVNNSADLADENADDDEDKSKSEISMVHEIALRHNLPVTFDVTRESGPPHMKTFVTQCLVGTFKTDAEGNSKKLSKKRAAELMLQELRHLPQIPPSFRPKTKPVVAKKKNRNLIKQMQKADPTYGVGINPISRLIQIQQAQKKKEPLYSLLAERGMPRRREFVMQVQVDDYTCTGVGPNKKLAKRHAAEAMLQLMGFNKPSPQPTKPAIKTQGDTSLGEKKVTFSDKTEESGAGQQMNGQSSRQMVPGLLVLPDGTRNTYAQHKGMQSHQNPYAGGVNVTKSFGSFGMRPEMKLREVCGRHNIDVKYDEFAGSGNRNEFLSRVLVGSNPPHTLHGSGATPDAARDSAAITALKLLTEMGVLKEEMLMNPAGDGS